MVVQADLLSGMETVVVAPLDDDAPMYDADPLAVHVSGKEAGTRSAQVVVVHLLAALSVQKFEALPAGRLTSRSISELEGVLRTVLQL